MSLTSKQPKTLRLLGNFGIVSAPASIASTFTNLHDVSHFRGRTARKMVVENALSTDHRSAESRSFFSLASSSSRAQTAIGLPAAAAARLHMRCSPALKYTTY